MEFTICVANRNILIHGIDSQIRSMCSHYLTDEMIVPDIEIICNERLITAEYERSRALLEQSLNSSTVESVVVLRLLAEEMLSFDILLLHGAVVAVDNAAFMFTAKTGTGKTTHIQTWLRNIDNAYVVNGDKPFIIVRKAGELPLACGSPWAGKENMETNTIVPLKAIVFLERAEENHIERISFGQAFPFLLEQVYRPKSEDKMRKTLRLMQQMNPAVSFWRFQCNNLKKDSFDVAYNALIHE